MKASCLTIQTNNNHKDNSFIKTARRMKRKTGEQERKRGDLLTFYPHARPETTALNDISAVSGQLIKKDP